MKITGKTRVAGLIGWPVEHSLSPVMHNAAFEHLGLDLCYVPFAVKDECLDVAIKAIPALNIVGLNVTIPHKERVVTYLSEVGREAAMIGAVNTIKVIDNKLIGYNTDGIGFTASIAEAGHPVQDRNILILGGGGSAKAVAFQSAVEGARRIIISNRTIRKAEGIKEQLEKYFPSVEIRAIGNGYSELEDIIEEIDIVVNATSVGLRREDPSPLPSDLLHKRLFVCDLIYNPPITALLRQARESGIPCMNGLRMLLHQGAASFKIWTGIEPPIEVMRQSIEDALRKIRETS